MKRQHLIGAALSGVLTLAGCAQNAASVTANYVPTDLYAGETCTSLKKDRAKVVYEVNTLTGQQNAKAQTDAIAVGAGMILFWLTLFLLAKDMGNTAELADAKGRYETIERVGQSKGCW